MSSLIATLNANPARIVPFQTTSLDWTVTRCDLNLPNQDRLELRMAGEWLPDLTGSMVVSPLQTVTYHLIAAWTSQGSPRTDQTGQPIGEGKSWTERIAQVTVEVDTGTCTISEIPIADFGSAIQSRFPQHVIQTRIAWSGIQVTTAIILPLGFDIGIINASHPRINIDICIALRVMGPRTIRCSILQSNSTPHIDIGPLGLDFLREPKLSVYKDLLREFLERITWDPTAFAQNICLAIQDFIDSRIAKIPGNFDLIGVAPNSSRNRIGIRACSQLPGRPNTAKTKLDVEFKK